jgi:hypothetical protein
VLWAIVVAATQDPKVSSSRWGREVYLRFSCTESDVWYPTKSEKVLVDRRTKFFLKKCRVEMRLRKPS